MLSKLLVVGGDSLIGSGLVKYFRKQGVIVHYTSRRPNHGSPDCIPLELGKALAVPNTPDVAILCAGVTDFRTCAEQPDATRRINVDAVLELAAALHLRGSRILYLSSNAVCEIEHQDIQSASLPTITTEYGAQKFAAERGILALGDGATVLRATKVISCKSSLISGWLIRLRNYQEITPLLDFYFCPISLRAMVLAIAKLAYAGASGLFNLSGAAPLTYSDFAYQLAATMNVNKSLVAPKNELDSNIPSYYPRTLACLDMTAMTAASGVLPQSVGSVIDDLLAELLIDQSPASRPTSTFCETE